MDSNSGESSSEEGSRDSSEDEPKGHSKQSDHATNPRKKTTKAHRTLDNIKADFQTKQRMQKHRTDSSRRSTRQSPIQSTQSMTSQDFVPSPKTSNAWGDTVSSFQCTFQRYRESVMDEDKSDDLASAEIKLKAIGSTLLKRCQSEKSDDTVKAKCRQFLQYVCGYCESQNQMPMHAFFSNLLSEQVKGYLFS